MNDEVQHPAKALEGVEPVACLVETEQGVMVWPISDFNKVGAYCDEDEFPELLYSAATVSALQARLATQAEHQAKALEGVEPVACLVNADAGAMVWPISDINEAETYCDEGEFPEPLYSATTVSALQARIAELEQDAARYRKLLDLWNGRDMRELFGIEDFAAIDAARKESK